MKLFLLSFFFFLHTFAGIGAVILSLEPLFIMAAKELLLLLLLAAKGGSDDVDVDEKPTPPEGCGDDGEKSAELRLENVWITANETLSWAVEKRKKGSKLLSNVCYN